MKPDPTHHDLDSPSDPDPSEDDVRSRWSRFHAAASVQTLDDLRGGTWFAQLLSSALRTYTRRVTAEWLREKYPSLPPDAIADRRIALAQRYSLLVGGLSAGAYSAAVVATLGTAGGASPLTLPAGIASLAADLWFCSLLQLRVAWDLAVIYRHPLDLDDPDDMWDLLTIAFGVKAGETFHNAVAKLAPEATRTVVKRIAAGATLQWLKALPIVGKYLLQRTLIKAAIPMVSIPLSMGINYFSTGAVAKSARSVFRRRGLVPEEAAAAASASSGDPLLALQLAYLVVRSDGVLAREEARFLQILADLIADHRGTEGGIEDFRTRIDVDEKVVIQRLTNVPEEHRAGLLEIARRAAGVDGRIHRRENALLERIAAGLAIPDVG